MIQNRSKRHKCLGIITARGGSKGVPNKNIRDLAGKPMINYAIEIGLNCPYIDTVMVSTDSEEIGEVAAQAGADIPFIRPSNMATDSARQEDAILHAMDWYEANNEKFELICLLQPTEPLRQIETINAAFELLSQHPEADGIMSVTKTESTPSNSNTLRSDNTLCGFIDPKFRINNRQEAADFYKLSGVVSISYWRSFRQSQSFCQDKALSIIVDPIESVDVDNPVDFLLAETLIQKGFHTSADLDQYVRLRN
jgi:CMP-N,N'-diacetyllegionaminic acid synthase